jgi:hypothetical protein
MNPIVYKLIFLAVFFMSGVIAFGLSLYLGKRSRGDNVWTIGGALWLALTTCVVFANIYEMVWAIE